MSNNNTTRGCGPKLCSVCGPNINTEDVNFSRRESNLVYLDKVYSYNDATACPILFSLPATTNWTTELSLENIEDNCGCNNGCGCGNGCGFTATSNGCGCVFNCNCGNGCTLTSDAVFTVNRSYVLVGNLGLSNGTLAAGDVTVDGVAVDTLTQAGNRYTATTDNLVSETNKARCRDLGLPTKSFFLITGAGPWQLTATIVLEGTVNTNGKTCCFQARFTTPNLLNIPGTSTFAIPKLALPCSVNGVSPTINFSFGGTVHVLNPEITATCNGNNGTNCTLTLTGSLAVQPQVNVEVVRRTLFCIDACEGMLPCDGTVAAFEADSLEDEDCTWPPEPACRCGRAHSPENDADICDTAVLCDFEGERTCNCNNEERAENNSYQWNGCNGCNW